MSLVNLVMMENKVILEYQAIPGQEVMLDFKDHLAKRGNLDHLVAKAILVSQEKKETLDRLALVDLLVVLVTKGHLVLKVQLVQEEIQVRPEKLEDLEFQENRDFLVPLDKLVLEV